MIRTTQSAISFVKQRYWLTILFFIIMPAAMANMLVSPLKVSLGPENTDDIIRVHSRSDRMQYIQVRVKKVLNPATAHQREVDAAPVEGEDIIVSPQRFILPAGDTQTVRLVAQRLPDSELAYRVYITPVSPAKDAGQQSTATPPSVSVNIGWGALVLLLPAQAREAFVLESHELKNTGNVGIKLKDLEWCRQDKCTHRFESRSLFPGHSLPLDRPKDSTILKIHYRPPSGQDMEKTWRF